MYVDQAMDKEQNRISEYVGEKDSDIAPASNIKETIPHKKSMEEKLIRRIKREFKKCTYIGDILISDEEYEFLRRILKFEFVNICRCESHTIISPVLAVALVQIGYRYYNGKFWPYVQQEIGKELSYYHHDWLGTSFYQTLLRYHKCHVGPTEFVNNILLHCFITKYYADDLFDFIFAYYQIDLDRDLSRNNKEMRSYLMQSMMKGEISSRAYKIKKHTSDAVSANERGCKIRVGRILRFMDNALFHDIYPENSRNRVAELFCEWAKSSPKFDVEKKHVRGLTQRGAKQFSTPYIHFDGNHSQFGLILPAQYIRLEEDEEIPEISWHIRTDAWETTVSAEAESCVTGCKTVKIQDVIYPSENIFENCYIELIKNEQDSIKTFRIKADSVRFFDHDWDMLDSMTYSGYLPVGNAYAFTQSGDVILTDSDSVIGCEEILGYMLYTLDLQQGDILRLPDGKAKSVGKPLEEGILSQSKIAGAYCIYQNEKLPIYSHIPSIYFRMNPAREKGTLLYINHKKYIFDVEKCIHFDVDDKANEKGYILKLADYFVKDGIYEITIDIPNSKKIREYTFVYIQNFGFHYDCSAYIFKKQGIISFLGSRAISGTEKSVAAGNNQFSFSIDPAVDYLPFTVMLEKKQYDLRIYLPVFKWKFDDEEWNIEKPEDIWHKEMPDTIYIKYPDDEINFYMNPIMLESDTDDEEETFAETFIKNKETHMFTCDTRKMISWLGTEEPLRTLFIKSESLNMVFAHIVTRCWLVPKSSSIVENFATNEMIFKNTILGFSDCFADIFYNDTLLVEKKQIVASGIRVKIPYRSGNYKIVFYETDDEDEDFGFIDYQKFDEVVIPYHSKMDFTNKKIYISGAKNTKEISSIFKATHYDLKEKVMIHDIVHDEYDAKTLYGMCDIGENLTKVKLTILDEDCKKITLSFFSEEDEEYFDFLYNKRLKTLVTEEDENEARKNYEFLDSEEYYFDVDIR